MVVIIEGLDGVGKTTLSKQFAEKYNFEYIKESYTDDCKEKEKRMVEFLQRLLSEKNYIYDRTTLIDDFVYGFLNNEDSTLEKYKSIILALLSKSHIFHIHLDEEVRRERFNQRGDCYVDNEMMSIIAGNYGVFYSELDNVQYFDITDKNVEQSIEEIKQKLEVL